MFTADPAVSRDGLRSAIDDIVATGELATPAPQPETYVDSSYLERAR